MTVHHEINAAKKLARGWRSLARGALTLDDIEQEILLAQLEFDAGLRTKDPRQHPGLIYCQIASAHAQISVGGSNDQLEDGFDYIAIAGTGIEHIDPVAFLEISQLGVDDDVNKLEMASTSSMNLARMMGISTRHVRNVKNVMALEA